MFKYDLSIVLIFVGLGFIVAGQISSFIIFLYQWGSLENPAGPSAWFAFKVWLSMLIPGLLFLFFSFLEYSKKKDDYV